MAATAPGEDMGRTNLAGLKPVILAAALLGFAGGSGAAQPPAAPSTPASQPVPGPPAHHPGAGPWPATQIGGVIIDDDYPARAMRSEEQGDVVVALLIGRDGRVLECDVEVSSGSYDLDFTTCRLILIRFRYDPARDADGWAIDQRLLKTVAWRLPGVEMAPATRAAAAPAPDASAGPSLPDKIATPLSGRFATLRPLDYPQDALRAGAEGVVAIRLPVDERGRPTGCSVIQSSGHAALDSGTCALARRFHYRPARNRSGPVAAVADEEVEWRIDDDGQPRVRLLGPLGPPYPWVITTPPKPAP